jgi:hypothetical protein
MPMQKFISPTPRLCVPRGGAARVFHLAAVPGLHPGGWAVMIATRPEDARPERLAQRGRVFGVITHDEGLTWPSPRGEAMAAAVLTDGGGPVALVFNTLADALACMRRLERRGAGNERA